MLSSSYANACTVCFFEIEDPGLKISLEVQQIERTFSPDIFLKNLNIMAVATRLLHNSQPLKLNGRKGWMHFGASGQQGTSEKRRIYIILYK